MSHVATVDVEILDLDALDAACKRCGLELVRDRESFRYYRGNRAPCDHLIRMPGNEKAYEIGVLKLDGKPGYTLRYDDFMGGYGMVSASGNECSALRQHYAAVVAMRTAQRQGYRVNEQRLSNGKIKLVLTK